MDDPMMEGGCLCGAVRYAIRGTPLGVEYCHCGMCRKHTGSPVAGWMDVATDDFAWRRGAPKEFPSSEYALRGFCGDCGSPLSFRRPGNPERLSITLGSLDRPGAHPPRQHIYFASRLDWLRLEDDLPHHEGAADPSG